MPVPPRLHATAGPGEAREGKAPVGVRAAWLETDAVDIAVDRDQFGRLVCTIDPGDRPAVVTAWNAGRAAGDLLAALDETRETGYGECLWPEEAGEHRWILRRTGGRVAVAVLWSGGTLTGWQHVLHTETDFEGFALRLGAGLLEVVAAAGPGSPQDAP